MKIIWTFTKALYRWAKDGFRKAPWQVRIERYKICVSCKRWFLKPKPKLRVCKLCDCNLKVKTGWRSEQCPAKKWLKVTR